jgi:4-phytase/acid phosphatase
MNSLRSIVAASLLIGLSCSKGVSQSSDPVTTAQRENELLKAIVISRHGIRAPLQTSKELERYSTSPWPQWDVPPGNLTTHGKEVMKSLDKFYAAYYEERGLFRRLLKQNILQEFITP